MNRFGKDNAVPVPVDKAWRDGLPLLALDLRRAVPGGERVLLHGSAVRAADPGDVDLALVVKEGTDRFDALKTMASFLADRSVATGLLHTCFPIEQTACSCSASQYVRNVFAHGSEL